MRISLIIAAAVVLASSVAVGQQQPTIQVPVPNIPGVTTPQQQRPYYPPGQEPYRGDQLYRGDQGYRGDPAYSGGGGCQDLAYQERDIRDRLNDAPPSGQQHDRLVYRLGQVRNQLQRCR